jgi:uncharacterized SAM-binding protein YcdF (DUF218 family)
MIKKMRGKWMTILWAVFAIVCIVSGGIVMSMRTGSSFYLFWFASGLFFLMLSIAAHFHYWALLPKKLRAGVLVLVALGAIIFAVIEGCILSGFHQKGKPGLKYIVVLGAQVFETRPSRVLRYRLDTAVDYLKENPETICIVSGGQGANEPRPEADVMAEYLEKAGISSERILKERKSETTMQNISFSRKLMKEEGSVAVVTNNFHVFRALQIARKNGLKDVCGIAAPTSFKHLPNNMMREFFAEVKFWFDR